MHALHPDACLSHATFPICPLTNRCTSKPLAAVGISVQRQSRIMVFTVERWSFAAGSPASLIPQTCSRLVRFKMHACMQARIDGWMMQGRMEPYLRASAQSCAQSGIFCGAKQWCNDAVSLNTNQSYAKQCNTYGCTEYALVYVCVCPEHHIALSLHHPCDSMHAPAV